MIQAMRASLENKATDEFLSPKLAAQDGASETEGDSAPSIAAKLDDPLGALSGDSKKPTTETADDSSSTVTAAVSDPASTIPASAPAPVPSVSNTANTAVLEDAIKELKSQLSAKSEQCQSLEESLAQKTGELTKQKSDHDEKMKKMKAIFAAANKNLNEYRTSIATKDEEIKELKAKLENSESTEEQASEQNRMYNWKL